MPSDAPKSGLAAPKLLNLSGHLPGLDVLRGCAIGSVLVFHGFANAGFTGAHSPAVSAVIRLAELGKLGVTLFFVLSGFLITTILVKQRERPNFYKNFYVRRACGYCRLIC